jgi:chemotaxis protein CheX
LEEAAKEVFSLMVGMELSPLAPADAPETHEVTAMIGMAGELCGVFGVCCSKPTAITIASHMLGLSDDEAVAHSSDAIGEVCNMVAGSFKSKLKNGLEDKCMLSVPTVITGDDYALHSLVVSNRLELAMQLEGNPVKFTLELRS